MTDRESTTEREPLPAGWRLSRTDSDIRVHVATDARVFKSEDTIRRRGEWFWYDSDYERRVDEQLASKSQGVRKVRACFCGSSEHERHEPGHPMPPEPAPVPSESREVTALTAEELEYMRSFHAGEQHGYRYDGDREVLRLLAEHSALKAQLIATEARLVTAERESAERFKLINGWMDECEVAAQRIALLERERDTAIRERDEDRAAYALAIADASIERDGLIDKRDTAAARAAAAEGLLRRIANERADLIVALDRCRGDYVGTYAHFAGCIAALTDGPIRAHLATLKPPTDAGTGGE